MLPFLSIGRGPAPKSKAKDRISKIKKWQQKKYTSRVNFQERLCEGRDWGWKNRKGRERKKDGEGREGVEERIRLHSVILWGFFKIPVLTDASTHNMHVCTQAHKQFLEKS